MPARNPQSRSGKTIYAAAIRGKAKSKARKGIPLLPQCLKVATGNDGCRSVVAFAVRRGWQGLFVQPLTAGVRFGFIGLV